MPEEWPLRWELQTRLVTPPKNTMDPLSLKIDSSDQGYGVHAMGNLVEVANKIGSSKRSLLT